MTSTPSSSDVPADAAGELEVAEPHQNQNADGASHPAPRQSLLDVSRWDEREAVRAAANRELHADLLEAAVERLGKIAVFSAVLMTGYLVVLFLVGPAEAEFRALFSTAARLLLAGIVSSVGLYAITRSKRVRPQFITDLGYAYLFSMCLFLSVLRHAQASDPAELLRQVSPIVLPILAFAALIPAAPLKSLIVSFGAALMDPLALFITRAHVNYPARELAILFASPLLAALVGHQISRVVHGLSQGIVKAREVGSYELVERLGTGGMAEVWRANHRMLARPAAVKLIRPEILANHGPMDSERLLRLFTREARATASLSSPHTIQVYDFGVTREGAFYYVMELLEGVDLATLVERFGPQRSERVAYLLIQACQSLQEAHGRDFVHRDIKPANIFTCRVGGEHDFVKVLDFGLVLEGHPTPEELEDEKRFVGTPAVMAPEMVRFQAPVDARADLYALGCVAYWLLTQRRVFQASTRHDMLVMHAHQKPVLPSKHVTTKIHPGLEAIVMSCLEKNPNRRPQTARELGELLAQLEFEEPWTAERAGYWWKQHAILPTEPDEDAAKDSESERLATPAPTSRRPEA